MGIYEQWMMLTCVLLLAAWLGAVVQGWDEERWGTPDAPLWSCRACGWSGPEPSLTDAAQETERDGRIIIDRTHRAVCPLCFEDVNRGVRT